MEFVARIRLDPDHWDDNDGDHLEQAVQNAVGHTGAVVVSAGYPCAACGFTRACGPNGEDCHS